MCSYQFLSQIYKTLFENIMFREKTGVGFHKVPQVEVTPVLITNVFLFRTIVNEWFFLCMVSSK